MKMTLQNLLRIGKLRDHAPTAAEVLRLLAAVDRNLADAAVSEVSDETRFDAAYKAVMQCSLAAMMASGYRPSTSEPGGNDYTGDVVTPDMVAECVAQATQLRALLRKHLTKTHPELLKKNP
jgi:hypothetical protein